MRPSRPAAERQGTGAAVAGGGEDAGDSLVCQGIVGLQWPAVGMMWSGGELGLQ
jgi:hypothetical protein